MFDAYSPKRSYDAPNILTSVREEKDEVSPLIYSQISTKFMNMVQTSNGSASLDGV